MPESALLFRDFALCQVCRYAIACIGNLAVNEDNKAVICAMKGVEIIVDKQMSSTNPKVLRRSALMCPQRSVVFVIPQREVVLPQY